MKNTRTPSREGGVEHDAEAMLTCGYERAFEEALDALFDAVSGVRHILHARLASQGAGKGLFPAGGADTLRSEPAHASEQEAYVLGLDAMEMVRYQMTGLAAPGGRLPLPWAVQGILDTFAGRCRLAPEVQGQVRGRLVLRARAQAGRGEGR